jgi:GR25 family glycosyltransferase involved in LPS biosynthesis
MNKINFPCDEIYLLNLYERQDKFDKMQERFKFMNMDVIPFRTVKHPFQDKMSGFIRTISLGIDNGAVFSCTREHYTIIKQAYLRGLNSIGIIEDDCSFYKDVNVWNEYFNNLPKDWDVLRVNCLRGVWEENVDDDVYWFKVGRMIPGTGFYILNRKAMAWIINYLDNRYVPIDHTLELANDWNSLNVYLPKIELGLCLEDSFESDIRCDCRNKPEHNYFRDIKRFNQENYI